MKEISRYDVGNIILAIAAYLPDENSDESDEELTRLGKESINIIVELFKNKLSIGQAYTKLSNLLDEIRLLAQANEC